MDHNLGLAALVNKVVSAIEGVDDHVLSSHRLSQEVVGPGQSTTPASPEKMREPEERLEDLRNLKHWEAYFDHLLNEWNEDDDGKTLSEAQFNFIVERLTSFASTLDHYGPQLVRRYLEIPSVPEERIQGVLKRRAVLNSFLNSAEIDLEHWYRHAGKRKIITLRRS